MTFKYYSVSSKVAPIESQCMISYQQSIVTFAVSRTVLEKFDVKQSNDLDISPRSLTVASRESCRVAMQAYVKCSEDSERKKRKLPFSTTTLSFDAPSPANPREYLHNLILPETTFAGLHFCCRQHGQLCKFSNSFVRKPETPTHLLPSPKQILTQNGHSRSFKVIYFGITEEPLRGYVA